MSSTGARKKRTPFDIAIESLRDTNNADIENMKKFSAESSPIAGQAGGASTNSATPGGSFLNIAGQTPMLGAIAFNPVDVQIDSNGRINITPGAVAPSDYSTYVLMTGTGTPDNLNFIDGAANNGQLLYLQGTAAQVLTIKHAEIGTISNIVGTTTVTVTTSAAHGLTTGETVDISGTTNFNIQNATITVTGGTTFTYAATGSATPETSGSFQNGNVVTSDGSDIILDGTTASLAVPWIALLFDPTVIANGGWRVQFGAGSGGTGLTEPVILGINTLTPQTSPTVTPIAWNTKNPQHITIDRNITFSFTNLPTSGSYEGILVIIDIDGTGGFDTPIWPASVTNPPTVSTVANTRTSVMLYTIDGGTTVTHATSVGSSTGGTLLSNLTIDVTKDWAAQGVSNFGNLTGVTGIDLDGVSATIEGVVNLQFFQTAHSINSLSGEMDFQVASTDFFRFIAGGAEIARFEDIATVLSLDMKLHAIKNVKHIDFDTAASETFPNTAVAIGYDTTANELRYNVENLGTHNWSVNGVPEVEIAANNMTFRDGYQVIFNPDSTNAGLNVGLLVGDTSAPENGDIYYNSTTNKFVFRENGAFVGLGATPNAIVQLDSNVTVTDAGSGLITMTVDGTQRYSIQATRADYANIPVFGVTALSFFDTVDVASATVLTQNQTDFTFNVPVNTDTYQFEFNSVIGFSVDLLQTRIFSNTPNTVSATLSLFRDDPSPTANDALGDIDFDGRDSAANFTTYASFVAGIESPTSGSEVGRMSTQLQNGGLLELSNRSEIGKFTVFRTSSVATDTATLNLAKTDATPLIDEDISQINFQLIDTGVTTTYAGILAEMSEVTDSGRLNLQVRVNNSSLTNSIVLEGDDDIAARSYMTVNAKIDSGLLFGAENAAGGSFKIAPDSSAGAGVELGLVVQDNTSFTVGTLGTVAIPSTTTAPGTAAVADTRFGTHKGALGLQDTGSGSIILFARQADGNWASVALARDTLV